MHFDSELLTLKTFSIMNLQLQIIFAMLKTIKNWKNINKWH